MSETALNRSHRTAMELGAIRNHLKILSEDNRKVRPDAFSQISNLNKTETGATLGISRQAAYQREVALKPEIMEKVKMLVLVTDVVYELLNKNLIETRKWVVSPNTLLFGDTPFEVCLRGDGQRLLSWLSEQSSQASPLPFPLNEKP